MRTATARAEGRSNTPILDNRKARQEANARGNETRRRNEQAFVTFANQNRLCSLLTLIERWRTLGNRITDSRAATLLLADGGAWAQAAPERRALQGENRRGAKPGEEDRSILKGFTSPHGPSVPEKPRVIDPHDLRAVCRRYLAEHRKVRRGWQSLTLEAYQAANAAAQARAELTYNAGREYRERKAVGA